MRPLPPLRYLLLTLLGAAAVALVGCMALYLCVDGWRTGEVPLRHGGRLSLSASPLLFTLMTAIPGSIGLGALLVVVPSLLSRLFASPADRRAQEARMPQIYGRTRPSLLWALGLLLALIGWACLRSLLG